MIDMFPNIFEVGNPGTLALIDECVEDKVTTMIDDVHSAFGRNVTTELLSNILYDYDIDYPTLPTYLKNYIDDEFDIID